MKSGLLVTLAVLLPNILVLFFPPAGIPEAAAGSRAFPELLIQILERIGQVGVFVIPCFYHIEIQGMFAVLTVALIALAIYYAGWTRDITQGRAYRLLFSPLLGIPLPMAVCPVAYLAAWSILFNSWPLAAATLVPAIGHISVSNKERRKSLQPRERTAG